MSKKLTKKQRSAAAKKGAETRAKNRRKIEREMYEDLLRISGQKKKKPKPKATIDEEIGDWEAEGTGELDS